MKKLMSLLFIFMLLLVPFVAFAEEGEGTAEVDNRAVVYFFHGDGCPHCAEAEAWFESIEGEYGSKFVIKKFETWKSETNAAIMQQISDARGDNATGVPYIIIGDKSWIGFSETTMADEIKAQIDQVFQTSMEERYDALSLVKDTTLAAEEEKEEKSTASDVVALIIILVVAGGVCFAVYQARKTTN